MTNDDDIKYMQKAIEEARQAARAGEVPVGAVIVCDDEVVAQARNEREERESAMAHAEILAIEEASKKLGRWRLSDCTIYVTKEPCPMCAGAIFQARMKRLVFGPSDQKSGAAGTLYNIVQDERLNWQLEVTRGVLEEENRELLQDFFRARRAKAKDNDQGY
ncbi:MAG: tRNA-specific adenosine deaminase [Candidatus Aquicultor secundus]|uniref:tRNA-specific adenosine deaminase n=1 Tax=Candidatus Aquicultor secundus TaxID=1973895 RepID=A0A2M7T725_9ACTN|nr:tRNA adenosine(34) deaminase TadA [Candidatus Aquicultor secundus]NCO65104.1 nucleoside deaminase [Solirubrobacter sp.]OIO88224.1 MAG: tRNA-specific adenosine deaminase [Candidatus Aquicultor secundus]PIU27201.1 MAG: tRNA-specific adenosine deaminase [Candidatus Aquicultor secundus]PIW21973.1 MAG: tRNA-specific adenosine deaminase [Candidatus Aquicultor secundus]PIX51346.1 MAG: tRNA-specific adenosine deaminase [Candidatus Aquicultor secundus]